MKYFDIETVVNSYKGFQDCMTNKSWGYLALLKGCKSNVYASHPFEVELDDVSNFLENIFNLSQNKKEYNTGRSLYVVFSNKWDNYFHDQGKYTPNIYDVAVWAYRRRSFPDEMTEEDVLRMFAKEFNISLNIIKHSFSISSKEISFSDSLYSETTLKSELSRVGVDVSMENIDAKKGGVVASPGEISRGPFIQTLYAGLEITDYVIILQSDYKSLYGDISELQKIQSNTINSCNSLLPYLTAIRTKPFLLLAGISGTGKSRIVRKLAQATNDIDFAEDYDGEDRWKMHSPSNFCLIQVKPNWHNSMDVVGFKSNIGGAHYEFTPFVEFIAKAWHYPDTPFFLCLDEMNLAPVEEYFAEFLSAIESRSNNKDGEYETDPIINAFDSFGPEVCGQMIRHLVNSDIDADCKLENQFRTKGLSLPKNLIVMGTVNMDETTFSFSRKVLDRAMSIEMNEVDYDAFLTGQTEEDVPLLTGCNKLLVDRPINAQNVKHDIDADKIIDYLKSVNALLEGTPFKLGYRAANEAFLYVSASKMFGADDLGSALDKFTLMKILSRIEGDDSKLKTKSGEELLPALLDLLNNQFGEDSKSVSVQKLTEMNDILIRDHFVSFWG